MKALKYFCLSLLIIATIQLKAQHTIFIEEGKIEFEKKVNQYAGLDESDSWSELEKKTMSKFKTTYFDLLFSKNKTIYQPGRENPDNNKMFFSDN